MNKLRLLVTKECYRKCPGCCNKQWDLDNLPVVTDYTPFDYGEILITGGEPLHYICSLTKLIDSIRYEHNCHAKIIVYTAQVYFAWRLRDILRAADGITITLHKQEDVSDFVYVDLCLADLTKYKYCRLNVFKGLDLPPLCGEWIIENNMEWIKNCPLPKDEVFMRLPEFFEEQK